MCTKPQCAYTPQDNSEEEYRGVIKPGMYTQISWRVLSYATKPFIINLLHEDLTSMNKCDHIVIPLIDSFAIQVYVHNCMASWYIICGRLVQPAAQLWLLY